MSGRGASAIDTRFMLCYLLMRLVDLVYSKLKKVEGEHNWCGGNRPSTSGPNNPPKQIIGGATGFRAFMRSPNCCQLFPSRPATWSPRGPAIVLG
jgi:hypothetical protein